MAITGARHACNQIIDRLTQVAVDIDPNDRGCLLHATAVRAFYLESDPYRALQEAWRATALFRESGNRQWLAEALFGVGLVLTDMGVWTDGEEVLREAREVALANGHVFYATVIHLHLGFNLVDPKRRRRQKSRAA